MPSAKRRRQQSGQSLVEALVASALVAIAVVAGLQALDTAATGARVATHAAWGRCVARGELEAVSAAAWSTSLDYPAPANVTAHVTWPNQVTDAPLEKVVITVTDPATGLPLLGGLSFEFYKARALAGPSAMTAADAAAVNDSCRGLLGT